MIETNGLHISPQTVFTEILFSSLQQAIHLYISSHLSFLIKQQVLTHPLTSHTPLPCQPFYHNLFPHSSTSLAITASDRANPQRRETRPSFTFGKFFPPSALANSHWFCSYSYCWLGPLPGWRILVPFQNPLLRDLLLPPAKMVRPKTASKRALTGLGLRTFSTPRILTISATR